MVWYLYEKLFSCNENEILKTNFISNNNQMNTIDKVKIWINKRLNYLWSTRPKSYHEEFNYEKKLEAWNHQKWIDNLRYELRCKNIDNIDFNFNIIVDDLTINVFIKDILIARYILIYQ